MDDINKLKTNKKKYIILIVILLLVAIGGTYAFFGFIAEDSLAGNIQCYDINYTTGQEITGELRQGLTYLSGTSTDITMSVKSNCYHMMGTLYITTNDTNTMDLTDNALMYTVVEDGIVVAEGTVNGTKNQKIYTGFTLTQTSKNFKIYIWLNEDLEDDTVLNDESYSGYIHAEATLMSGIGPALLTINKLNLNEYLNSSIPSFGTTATTDEGIFKTADDLGVSYYFRGASEHNYVKFGKNESGQDMYWRIIRINGDGTIRMIYDGTEAHANGTSSTDRLLEAKTFNENESDNAHVGYMYGMTGINSEINTPMCLMLDENNNVIDNYTTYQTKETCEQEGGIWAETAYEATHANVKNSAIKDYTETWYDNIFAESEYEKYIADAIYCNDRGLASYNSNGKYSNKGYGTELTLYAVNGDRLDYNNYAFTPTLKCQNKNDRFTKNSMIHGVEIGNGKSEYPIGLITADEAIFAGGYITNNNKYYLYNGNHCWTMTPFAYNVSNPDEYVAGLAMINRYGALNGEGAYEPILNVRPVITLKADALMYSTTSNGTREYPFIVSQ